MSIHNEKVVDLVDDLRVRYECTAGFTRAIYMPEHRDLDLRAADIMECLTGDIRALRKAIEEMLDDIGPIDGTMKAWLIGRSALLK